MYYLFFSKVYEKVIEIKLADYFDKIFNPFLCAFRRGHGCQTTLLGLLEDWREALDKNQYVAAVLMDLSKAFDCLPHDILLDKLSAYGISSHSVSLLKSYLSNRKQQIKVNRVLSSWADIHKGVPQGSILGPSYLKSLLMTYFTLFLIAPCIIMQTTIPSHSVIQILMHLYLLWRLSQIN